MVAPAALGVLLAGCGDTASPPSTEGPVADWPHWGGSEGGSRYSPLTQITPQNVGRLKKAWTYHIGMIDAPEESSPTFEGTPIVAGGRMFVCSGMGKVAALDPETGKELWEFRYTADTTGSYLLNCRGVTYHADAPGYAGECPSRVFAGTLDGRLLALDAATGKLCAGFGDKGSLDLLAGLGRTQPGDFSISSPPVIVGDRIILGGRIPDNMRVDVPAGVIRAFDVHTGALAWAWNSSPPGMEPEPGEPYVRGTPNAWAPLAVDSERKLVFVPTGNPATDHTNIIRGEKDHYAASIVALDATTGQLRWHFQTVHKDHWDYDIPSQPVLFPLLRDGVEIPVEVNSVRLPDGTYFAAMRDVTDRRAAEAALRESEQRFRTLFESAAIEIIVADADGGVPRQANPRALRARGLDGQHRERKGPGILLRAERADERGDCQRGPARRPPGIVAPHVRDQGEQQERRHESARAPRNVGDRLRLRGVQCEDRRCEPRRESRPVFGQAAQPQHALDREEQQPRIHRMQRDVDGAKACRTPSRGPACDVRGLEERPDARHPLPPRRPGVDPGVADDHVPVVELEARPERSRVDGRDQHQQRQGAHP